MTPKDLVNPNVSISEKVMWLLNQCVAVGVLAWLGYMFMVGWPEFQKQQQAGYERNAQMLHDSAKTYEDTTNKLMTQMLEDRKIMIELARDSQRVMNRVSEAVN